MREMKFRLRNQNNKIVGYEKWYEGVLHAKDGYWVAKPQWLYSTDNFYWRPKCIEHRYKDQYSGLKDNNGKPIYLELHPNIGKEIYESDIVNVTFPNGGRVRAVIEENQFAWCYKSLFALDDSMNSQPLYSNPYPHYTHLDCAGYQFEIIGNLDENPELLENNE